jgi:hypothetical protein
MTTLFFSGDYTRRFHARLDRLRRFPIWIVYLPISQDYPGKWVARLHVLRPAPRPSRLVILDDTLSDLRAKLPRGLSCIERRNGDHYTIVEVWL